jgi:type II secretory pathway predicted ATPase ExeA
VTQFGKFQPTAVRGTRRSSLLTYEPYYGLHEKPFSLSADPRFLYKSPSHAPTFEDLRAGICRREGLIVLTGDIGTGKTTLCRAVVEELDRKTFSAFVPDPFLSREDLLKMLLIDFGVVSIDDLKSGRLAGASRPDLSYPLYEFLKSLVPLQAFAVMIIDEAQNLSPQLLEEIRILSDLEDPEKLLQVVLVGQLELHAKLKLPEMRQVDQRVSIRCNLQPLTRDVVAGYIAHRLEVAGGGRDRVEFSEDAVDEIYRVSRGVPRVVNLICDRALYHGYLERSPQIHPPHIVRASVDLGLRHNSAGTKPAPVAPPRITPARVTRAPAVPARRSTAVRVSDDLDASPMFEPENVPPRYRKPLGVGALIILLLGSAWILVQSYRQNQINELAQSIALPRLPATPTLPIGRSTDFLPMHIAASTAMAEMPAVYWIDVALFNSEPRAAALVDQLASAGYKAQSDERTSSQGRIHVVRVGPYIVQADADADLSNIRRLPGYGDARLATR